MFSKVQKATGSELRIKMIYAFEISSIRYRQAAKQRELRVTLQQKSSKKINGTREQLSTQMYYSRLLAPERL